MTECIITTLIDNVVYTRELVAEHGFSVHIDYNGVHVLFDVGQTDALIQNAHHLGINIQDINACVISHGHYDHTGGLASFCRVNTHSPIYIHKNAWLPKTNSQHTTIGIPDAATIPKDRCISHDVPWKIAENIYYMPAAVIKNEKDTHCNGFFCEENGVVREDDFSDEQSLVIIKNERLHIISGCSHRGITNIIAAAKDYFKLPVELVMGGMHIRNEKPHYIEQLCTYLNRMEIQQIGIAHCTGLEAYSLLQQKLKGKVFYSSVGTRITI